MSIAGVIGLFRALPQQPVGADGRMALGDHLRELRARLLRSVLVLTIALVLALFLYGQLLLQLKLAAMAAVVLTSPYWLYQIWAFVVPGLHPHEKRWTGIFVATAGPLFILGVCVGYYVLPKGLEVLIGFTPADLTNLVDFGEYFSFMTRMLLVV